MLSNRALARYFGIAALLWVTTLVIVSSFKQDTRLPDMRHLTLPAIPGDAWNGHRALADIVTQVSFGRRAPNTEGHAKTIEYIKVELARAPVASIETQEWTEGDLKLTNIIARIAPENPNRIVLATHYDSIVRAYRDKDYPNEIMPGANNSASGVALLLETARALGGLPPPPVGIDFVFFDGEEGAQSLGEGDKQWAPLGSPYFAARLNNWYPKQKPRAAAVFDMVCYQKLRLKPELFSLRSAREDVAKFWHIGNSIAPGLFTKEATPTPIDDDHTALQKAGIPAFLVIGFEYDPWYNTTQDTPDKCSAENLQAVGRTLLGYIFLK